MPHPREAYYYDCTATLSSQPYCGGEVHQAIAHGQLLTGGSLIARLDSVGSENFMVDRRKYAREWELILASRASLQEESTHVLLKHLPLGHETLRPA